MISRLLIGSLSLLKEYDRRNDYNYQYDYPLKVISKGSVLSECYKIRGPIMAMETTGMHFYTIMQNWRHNLHTTTINAGTTTNSITFAISSTSSFSIRLTFSSRRKPAPRTIAKKDHHEENIQQMSLHSETKGVEEIGRILKSRCNEGGMDGHSISIF
ncbi:hypothetical protein BCR42DRAFT_398845 [Absidia repens]|uniref:Uncharacterized protein n=1 Tax=Absidia repens TaxID=90262 RepID=A0A1X2HRA7_9FUNG|nr:hypothetical protein BCR42DRAFT_398845 [Absidia repens]